MYTSEHGGINCRVIDRWSLKVYVHLFSVENNVGEQLSESWRLAGEIVTWLISRFALISLLANGTRLAAIYTNGHELAIEKKLIATKRSINDYTQFWKLKLSNNTNASKAQHSISKSHCFRYTTKQLNPIETAALAYKKNQSEVLSKFSVASAAHVHTRTQVEHLDEQRPRGRRAENPA